MQSCHGPSLHGAEADTEAENHCLLCVQVLKLQLSIAALVYSLIEENGPAELLVAKVRFKVFQCS